MVPRHILRGSGFRGSGFGGLVSPLLVPLAFLAALALAAPALAGPPLLCHPFDIDGARSLPWSGTSSWFDGDPRYDRARLVADTDALLAPSTPVVVRMETLRRAAIYASEDVNLAGRMLTHLTRKVHAGGKDGRPDALAYLDAAYFVEALRQMTIVRKGKAGTAQLAELVAGVNGYEMIRKSLTLRPSDPALEFAAALIAADRDRGAYETHAAKARQGAKADALLARNVKQVSE